MLILLGSTGLLFFHALILNKSRKRCLCSKLPQHSTHSTEIFGNRTSSLPSPCVFISDCVVYTLSKTMAYDFVLFKVKNSEMLRKELLFPVFKGFQ